MPALQSSAIASTEVAIELLIVLFLFVCIFSLIAVAEVAFLKWLGFDIIAHLRMTHQSGKATKFYFEAFGVIAFILAQPVLFTAVVVWAYGAVRPDIAIAARDAAAAFGNVIATVKWF